MDISSIFGNAFEYTRRMSADLGRLVVLIVLDIIPIVNFIVLGYAAKVVRESPTSTEPPALKGYWKMWIQGLKIVGAFIIWLVLPIFLVGWSGVAFSTGVISGGWTALGVAVIIGAVAMLFIAAIFLAMAIIHMIKNDSFGKIFALGEIRDIIGRIGWGKYILWMIIIFVMAVVVVGIAFIPWIGWLVSLIIGPLFSVFIARSASLLYSEGVPTLITPPGGVKYCSNCGESLQPDAKFCTRCGQKVD